MARCSFFVFIIQLSWVNLDSQIPRITPHPVSLESSFLLYLILPSFPSYHFQRVNCFISSSFLSSPLPVSFVNLVPAIFSFRLNSQNRAKIPTSAIITFYHFLCLLIKPFTPFLELFFWSIVSIIFSRSISCLPSSISGSHFKVIFRLTFSSLTSVSLKGYASKRHNAVQWTNTTKLLLLFGGFWHIRNKNLIL